jgi:hypothetical protein
MPLENELLHMGTCKNCHWKGKRTITHGNTKKMPLENELFTHRNTNKCCHWKTNYYTWEHENIDMETRTNMISDHEQFDIGVRNI